jgi:hypothetical protein
MALRRLVALRRRTWAVESSKPRFPLEAPALRGGPLPKRTKQSLRRTPRPKKQFAKRFFAFCFSPGPLLEGTTDAPARVITFARSLLTYINDSWEKLASSVFGVKSLPNGFKARLPVHLEPRTFSEAFTMSQMCLPQPDIVLERDLRQHLGHARRPL